MMREMTGGCLCGQLRYHAKADPMFTAVCHCRNCQKQAGTAFSVVVAVPKQSVTASGSLSTYHDLGDSGHPVERRFCPHCGSPVFSEVAVMPDVVFIKAGTLDDPGWLSPTMEVYCASAQPWVSLSGDLQRFPGMPV